MKQQVENLKNWFIDQPIKGCITGSCLLDYFEGQDVDLFVYDEKSFINIVYQHVGDARRARGPQLVVAHSTRRARLHNLTVTDGAQTALSSAF